MTSIIAMARGVFAAGLQALKDPSDNPVAALFALAAIVLAMLILVLVAYFFVLSAESRRRGRTAPAPKAVSRMRSGRALVFDIVLAAVVLASLGYGWTYSSLDRVCVRCHFTERAVESHSQGTHAAVACRQCHIGPGIRTEFISRVRGAMNLTTQISGNAGSEAVSAEIRNGACIACHENIISGVTVARSIRMRHSDVLELGRACTDCHSTEGHGTSVRRARYPAMSMCIGCHDGETAAADCELCHAEDTGVAVRRLQRPFARTNVVREDCRGCHSMDTCIDCHGLELPHSQQFIEGYHARRAYLESEVCIKCHDLALFCNHCHRFDVTGPGATTWRRAHAASGDFVSWHPREVAAHPERNVCSCHDSDQDRYCDYCHGSQPER